MDFSVTPEQAMLRDTVAAYLADHYDFDRRRAAAAAPAGWRPAVWRAMAQEIAILGAPFPEALGGLGGGPIETMIIMEEFGKALVLEPFLGSVVIAGGFLRHSAHPQAEALIGQIVDGEAIYAFAQAEADSRYNLAAIGTTATRDGAGFVLNGCKIVVIGAPWASHLIVTARTGGGPRDALGVSVFMVEKTAAGVTTQDYATADGGRASDITFTDVRVGHDALIGPLDHGLPLVERVAAEAIAALCAEGCGVLRRLHEDTVAYTKQRRQFGQPIGAFQALQHRMADMFIALEQTISMTYLATLRLDNDLERAKAVAAAKVQLGRACKAISHGAIQLHGGLGVTEEMSIGHFFRRATLIEKAFGDTDHHLARYEFLSFGETR